MFNSLHFHWVMPGLWKNALTLTISCSNSFVSNNFVTPMHRVKRITRSTVQHILSGSVCFGVPGVEFGPGKFVNHFQWGHIVPSL